MLFAPVPCVTCRQPITGGIADAFTTVYVSSNPPLVSGQTLLVTSAGIGNFTDLKVRGTPRSYNVSFRASVSERPLSELVLQVGLRECELGEVTTLDNDKCIACAAETFSFSPANTTCDACPEHADCSGDMLGRGIVPEDGYWHSSPFSPQVQICLWQAACSYDNRTARLAAYQLEVQLRGALLTSANTSGYNDLLCAEEYTGAPIPPPAQLWRWLWHWRVCLSPGCTLNAYGWRGLLAASGDPCNRPASADWQPGLPRVACPRPRQSSPEASLRLHGAQGRLASSASQ